MSLVLEYCPQREEVLRRLWCLYEHRFQDIILASMEVPSQVLKEFASQHAAGYCEYPDPRQRIAFWDAYLHEHKTVKMHLY